MKKIKALKILLTAGLITLMIPIGVSAQDLSPATVNNVSGDYDPGTILTEEEANTVKENAVPATKIHTISSELSPDEISAKINAVADKYKVGEIFSDEDANFIKTYATPVGQKSEATIQPSAISINGGTRYFVGNLNKVELTGHGGFKLGFINNSINGNFVVRDTNKAYHKTIGSVVEFRAFGAFGEGGTNIGLVYSKDYTNSASNANYNKNVFEDTFVASVAYANYSVRGLVDGNSFITKTPDE